MLPTPKILESVIPSPTAPKLPKKLDPWILHSKVFGTKIPYHTNCLKSNSLLVDLNFPPHLERILLSKDALALAFRNMSEEFISPFFDYLRQLYYFRTLSKRSQFEPDLRVG